MAFLVDKARRQLRAFAQWVNITLETPGETQARILYQVNTYPLMLARETECSRSLWRRH